MTERSEKLLVAGLLAIAIPPAFVVLGAQARPIPAPAWLATSFDAAIPLWPEAVWLYASWYPASFLFLLSSRSTFRRAWVAELGAFFVCAVTQFLWPVSIIRPALDEYPGLSATALRVVYAADPPVNLFPSFHAAVAVLLTALRPSSVFVRAVVRLWVIGIYLSCVLTKQHYVLDVVTGILIGAGMLRAADHFWTRRERHAPHTIDRSAAQFPDRSQLRLGHRARGVHPEHPTEGTGSRICRASDIAGQPPARA